MNEPIDTTEMLKQKKKTMKKARMQTGWVVLRGKTGPDAPVHHGQILRPA
jgi:hypothetical protein